MIVTPTTGISVSNGISLSHCKCQTSTNVHKKYIGSTFWLVTATLGILC